MAQKHTHLALLDASFRPPVVVALMLLFATMSSAGCRQAKVSGWHNVAFGDSIAAVKKTFGEPTRDNSPNSDATRALLMWERPTGVQVRRLHVDFVDDAVVGITTNVREPVESVRQLMVEKYGAATREMPSPLLGGPPRFYWYDDATCMFLRQVGDADGGVAVEVSYSRRDTGPDGKQTDSCSYMLKKLDEAKSKI